MTKSDLEILNEMIASGSKVVLQGHYEKKKAVLTEERCEAKVEINNVPENAVIIKADDFEHSIFAGTKGEGRRADYVIIAEYQNRTLVIAIEIKKTKDGLKKIIEQLRGTFCFMEYCKAVGKSFWGEKDFLKNADYRFVSIGHLSPKRGTSVNRQNKKHDTPDNLLKIGSPHNLQFNSLL